MKTFLAIAAVILLLTGCASGGATYASASELQKAYVAAGGDCDKTVEAPEAMVSNGAHALMCPDVTFLIVFDSDEDKNRYLARVLDGENGLQAVVGERWAVMTENADSFAGKLGGTVARG